MIDTFSIKNILSIEQAKWLLNSISGVTPQNYIFSFIGKVTPWSIETEPDYPFDDINDYIKTWKDIISLKRIQLTDMTLAIKKIVWTSGTIYEMYDDKNINLFESSFYVFTSNNKIYKCLDNNKGIASTEEPDSSSLSPFTTADGYKWQLMFDISSSTLTFWQDSMLIPAKELTVDDSSVQWNVQSNAIPGTIDAIKVENAGSGYLSVPSVNITGDGTGATATAILNGNVISKIVITNRGSGYTYANVSITGNAILRAIISPINGHGSSVINELNGRYILVHSEFNKDETLTFPTDLKYRQIGLLMNPLLFGTSDKATDTAGILQMASITIDVDPSLMMSAEVIQNQTNNSTAVFATSTGNTINIVSQNGTFNIGDSIIGLSSGITATISAVSDPYLELYSGSLLYVENREPIERKPTQTETYRLGIAF